MADVSTTHYARIGENNVVIAVTLSGDASAASSVVWHAVNGAATFTVAAVAGAAGAVAVTLTDAHIAAANVGTWHEFWRVTDGADGAGPLDYPSDPRQRDRLVIQGALS